MKSPTLFPQPAIFHRFFIHEYRQTRPKQSALPAWCYCIVLSKNIIRIGIFNFRHKAKFNWIMGGQKMKKLNVRRLGIKLKKYLPKISDRKVLEKYFFKIVTGIIL